MKNLDKYIEKAKIIHNNFYTYEKTNPKTCKDKCIVTCPIHGDFLTTLDNHVNGKTGCPACKHVKKLTTEDFINKAKQIHGDKYDYSKVEYKNAKTKVCIICLEHGEFWQEPKHHLNGVGCPICKGVKRLTTEDFINKAKQIHGDKYDYSKVEYIDNHSKVCIICLEHGEFWQEASSHLSGCGCPKCNGGVNLTLNDFIKKANNIHNHFYDYSKAEYKNAKTKVCIICPKHGEFWQEASSHLSGKGCPKCKSSKLENIIINYFSKNSIGYIYQYKFAELGKKSLDFYLPLYNIAIECQGEQHYKNANFSNNSNSNDDFKRRKDLDELKYNICQNNNIDLIYFTIPSYFRDNSINIYENFYSDKKVFTNVDDLYDYIKTKDINKKEDNFNLFCNDLLKINNNIIIENNVIKYKNYAIIFNKIEPNTKSSINDKRRYYNKHNINSINIFEDEYVYHKDIVLNKIKHLLKINSDEVKIPGRKCTINNIDKNVAKIFLEKYHIQGFAASTIYLGAFFNDELIAVMSFKKESNNEWELNRFASNYNYICQGVGGKLYNFFIKKYAPIKVKSFADKRWTNNFENNLYTKIGFVLEKHLMPDYRYHNVNDSNFNRYHKFNFRKQILHKKYALPLTMTENEMAKKLGYYKIWDAGLYKYVWNSPIKQK